MSLLLLVMLLSIGVASLWNHFDFIKEGVHAVFDPTVGALLDWNKTGGMIIITLVLTLLTTILQKYATDQKTLKEIKDEQKRLQEEMKKYKDNPDKVMQLNKRSMELVGQTMPLTMKPIIYTAIPFVLFIRWFGDYFAVHTVKILGMSWFWAYLVLSIVFSSILRKVLKVH